jgi:uncharacterized membrane protein YeaQ/YmgE (transglycosylase-associated protein family)
MGLASWLAAGVVAWIAARIIPAARGRRWLGELAVAVAVALLLGMSATALDFGGWKEPDWRAGLFAFLGAFAGAGVFRLVTFLRRASLQ